MKCMSLPRACELINIYFQPLAFEAELDAPQSLHARVFDPLSGERLLTVLGIHCNASPTLRDVKRIIRTIESDLQIVMPGARPDVPPITL
jgi:hypothetical protein